MREDEVRFQILVLVVLWIHVFCDPMLCHLLSGFCHFEVFIVLLGLFDPEDEGTVIP